MPSFDEADLYESLMQTFDRYLPSNKAARCTICTVIGAEWFEHRYGCEDTHCLYSPRVNTLTADNLLHLLARDYEDVQTAPTSDHDQESRMQSIKSLPARCSSERRTDDLLSSTRQRRRTRRDKQGHCLILEHVSSRTCTTRIHQEETAV